MLGRDLSIRREDRIRDQKCFFIQPSASPNGWMRQRPDFFVVEKLFFVVRGIRCKKIAVHSQAVTYVNDSFVRRLVLVPDSMQDTVASDLAHVGNCATKTGAATDWTQRATTGVVGSCAKLLDNLASSPTKFTTSVQRYATRST